MRTVDDRVLRVTVLRVVELFPHHVVKRRALEEQNLPERCAEVAVERCVDDGVEEGIRVTEPQENA